jgi:hypothetical protein
MVMHKTSVLSIDEITAAGLFEGTWRAELPEFYALREVREQSTWHTTEETILAHAIRVYEQLEKLLPFADEVVAPYAAYFRAHLDRDYEGKSGEQLLKIMVLVHDIHKREALVTKPDGTTATPGHELMSARLPQVFAKRFGLNEHQVSRVREMTLLHDLPHNTLDILVHKTGAKPRNYLTMMKEAVGMDIVPELLLFVLADMRGSDVVVNLPQEYENRVEKWIELVTLLFENSR